MIEDLKKIPEKNLEKIAQISELIEFPLLTDILRYRAKTTPDRVLYTFLPDDNSEELVFTYSDLDKKAKLIAAKLLTTLSKGDRALLLYQPGLDFIAGFFGCLYAGVIAVPAYPPDLKRINKSLPRLISIIKDCQSSVILTTSDILAFIKSLGDSVPLLKKISWVTTDNISETEYQGIYNSEITRDDIAFLQYTSGSTGEPKGVIISHENMMANQEMIKVSFHNTPESTFASWLPQYHDMGLIGNLLHPLYIGSSCVFMPPFSFLKKPLKWLQVITKYKIKITGAPNFAYDLCTHKITEEEKKQLDLSSWIHAYNGAEPVKADSLERFYEAFKSCGMKKEAIIPVYGMAEATLIVSGTYKNDFKYLRADKAQLENNKIVLNPDENVEIKKLVSCGESCMGQKIVIVDPDTLNSCSNDTVGEIWLSGKNISKGYWNNPEKTKEIFQAYIAGTSEGPFLRTGDLGFIHNEELYVTGRIKDLIIIRGRNLYPFDIEHTMDLNKRHFPEIRLGCNAAFSIEKDNEEHLVIIQELDPEKNNNFNPELLAQSLRKSILEKHEISTYEVVFVKAGNVPKTSSGKTMRYACKKAFNDDFKDKSFEVISYNKLHSDLTYDQLHTKPSQQEEVKQTSIVKNVKNLTKADLEKWFINWLHNELKLHVEHINKNTSFADFGLDSLTSVRLIGDLEEFTGIHLSKTVLWDYQNISKLTSYLVGEKDNDKEIIIQPERKNYLAEPIAIIGAGCRLPGDINNLDDLWQVIEGKKDVISELPVDRYDIDDYYSADISQSGKIYTKSGGFLNDIDKFNPEFFGISPREAISLDPQQRLLLEVTWEALENSGKNISKLAGSDTGVFIGISGNDYSKFSINSGNTDLIDSYSGTGTAYSIASGRISYLLGLEGPSMSIDTACSSSLVAIHQACQSLRSNDCDMAVAGGVNVILAPEPSIYLCNIKALSPDGKCKTFDESANGYVRAEGCGIVILKRLSDAISDNDNILAVIRGSAINQDGKSNGLTAPNGMAQQKVIKKALVNAGLAPEDIDFIEAHGTGTPLGDPIEINALNAVFGHNRQSGHPLMISSVKANLGHLEAAAGITGLLKTILSIKNRVIPGNIHLQKLNPEIILDKSVVIASDNTKWENHDNKYFAGVSSFGLSGTNAHIILEAPPESKAGKQEIERTKQVFCLSAKTEKELHKLAAKFNKYLTVSQETLENICYSANISRTLFEHRLAILTESKAGLAKGLNDFSRDNFSRDLYYTNEYFYNQSAFIFTGQGSQYGGMGKQLYNTQPFFKKTMDECCQLFDNYLEKPLLSVIFAESSDVVNETAYTQPALFAIEYSLAKLLMYWGIKPTTVMGHSIGEFVAACIAEIFSLEDAAKLVSARGELMQSLPKNGSMFSIFSNENIVSEIISPFKEFISIAAVNGPNNVVISGDIEQIVIALELFKERNITFKELVVSHAFHSHLMQPIIEEFYKVAEKVQYSAPKIKFISNLTGKVVDDNFITDAKYWTEHILKPVLFFQSVETLCLDKHIHIIEVGPNAILNTMIQKFKGSETDLSHTLRKGEDDWKSLLKNLAKLFTTGININWESFDEGYSRKIVPLPTYFWDKKSYWLKRPHRVKTHEVTSSVETADTKSENNELTQNKTVYLSNQEIEIWLKDWVVREAGINPDKININTSFELYGLDSVITVMLLNDLEKWLGKKFSLSVPYDYPSIKDLANFLSGDYENISNISNEI